MTDGPRLPVSFPLQTLGSVQPLRPRKPILLPEVKADLAGGRGAGMVLVGCQLIGSLRMCAWEAGGEKEGRVKVKREERPGRERRIKIRCQALGEE
ncbi:UNVERIFIED_CONTAM: hypothetical protein K2H54_030876 [Gekko kuhli]